MSTFIEERIRDNHIARLAHRLPASHYSVDPVSFREMVLRLNAKVEGDGDHWQFVTLHLNGGSVRVYPDPDAPPGVFQPHGPQGKWHPPGMSDDALGVGDIVTLNSGGPPMTVVEVVEHDGGASAVAWWRALDGKPQILDIDVRCLQLISRAGP